MLQLLMESKREITLNEISHYVYCKRQWGLRFLNMVWTENVATVEGKLLHANADNPFVTHNRKCLRVSHAVPVYSVIEDLFGICDTIIFTKDQQGCYVEQLKDKVCITVVEYKRGKPASDSIDLHDAMQLAAQMLCVNEMFGCDSIGYIYYEQVRRRIKLEDYSKIISLLKETLKEIRDCYKNNYIPTCFYDKKCKNCSIINECLPKTVVTANFFDIVKEEL